MKDNYDFSNAKPVLSAEELRKRLMDCCKELKEYQMAADAEAKIVDRKHAEIQQLKASNVELALEVAENVKAKLDYITKNEQLEEKILTAGYALTEMEQKNAKLVEALEQQKKVADIYYSASVEASCMGYDNPDGRAVAEAEENYERLCREAEIEEEELEKMMQAIEENGK